MFADLILQNARIRDIFAPKGSSALAVAGGKILAIGSESEMDRFKGPKTKLYNVDQAELLPGFIESHLHLFMGGASLAMLNLNAASGFDQTKALFQAFIADNPGEEILFAYAVNYVIFGEDRRPDRHLLDQICADRPIAMLSTDLHCAWANTVALEMAGILQGAELSPGSQVVMAADGLASGELREFEAMNKVKMLSTLKGRDSIDFRGGPEVSAEARAYDKDLLVKAGRYCAENGITSAVNMDGSAYQAELLRELAEAGEMPVRVSLPLRLDAEDGVEGVAKIETFGREVPDWLHFRRVKLFMDGVFDTWTALTVSDYPEREGFCSEPLIQIDMFNAICVEADRRGLQVTTHAVGDGAVRAVIDAYELARESNGARDARHRIEHIDTITLQDLDRLQPLGIVASMQPVHPPGSAGLPLEPTTSIMGRARWDTAFPWAMIKARSVPLAFGTDWPVSPLSPLYAIHCALSRQTWAEDVPDQRISLEDCLRAYTQGGAYADFVENTRGRLEPGFVADLVLVSGQIEGLAADPDAARIKATICNGVFTFEAQA